MDILLSLEDAPHPLAFHHMFQGAPSNHQPQHLLPQEGHTDALWPNLQRKLVPPLTSADLWQGKTTLTPTLRDLQGTLGTLPIVRPIRGRASTPGWQSLNWSAAHESMRRQSMAERIVPCQTGDILAVLPQFSLPSGRVFHLDLHTCWVLAAVLQDMPPRPCLTGMQDHPAAVTLTWSPTGKMTSTE